MHADEEVVADLHMAEDEVTVLDTVAENMSVGADAGPLTDAYEIEGAAVRRRDRAIAADPRAHGAIVETHERRSDEHAAPTDRLKTVDDPPPEIIGAPERVSPRFEATDDSPLHRYTGEEPPRPNEEGECGSGLRRPPPFGRAVEHVDCQQEQEQDRTGHNRMEDQHGQRLDECASPAAGGADALCFCGGGWIGNDLTFADLGKFNKLRLFKMLRQMARGPVCVEVAHTDSGVPDFGAQIGSDTARYVGVPAKIAEKIIGHVNRRNAETALEALDDGPFHQRRRRNRPAVFAGQQQLRGGKALTVDLAAEHGRQLIEHVQIARDHVIRKPPAEKVDQSAAVVGV